jgi:hypothetical protein
MELWELLVPTVRNDGRPIHLRFHRVWDEKVRRISGGLTILEPVNGQWVSPSGSLFVERMIPVRIACSEADIHSIAALTARYYEQETVMYYRVSDLVFIKHFGAPQAVGTPQVA